MKKIVITAIIIGLIGGATFAQTTASSANVVGYVQAAVPPQALYQLVGFSFEGSTNVGVTLKELFGTNSLVKSNVSDSATKVHVYEPSIPGYVQFYQRANGDFRLVGASTATNYTFYAGNSFWLQSPSAALSTNFVSISGVVPLALTNNVYFPIGLSLFSNPYPTDMDLNSISLNWTNAGAKASNVSDSADKINIYVNRAYATFYLRAATGKWHKTGVSTPATDAIIPVGQGAWYEAKRIFTYSFTKPYSIE